jgi:hypothetical protein
VSLPHASEKNRGILLMGRAARKVNHRFVVLVGRLRLSFGGQRIRSSGNVLATGVANFYVRADSLRWQAVAGLQQFANPGDPTSQRREEIRVDLRHDSCRLAKKSPCRSSAGIPFLAQRGDGPLKAAAK